MKKKSPDNIVNYKGCAIVVVLCFWVIVLMTMCSDDSSNNRNYVPGDFDFDGDSGDIDDATKFLEWKMKQEE